MIRAQHQNYQNQPGSLFAGMELEPEIVPLPTVDRAVKTVAQPLQSSRWKELRWKTCGGRNVSKFTDSDVDQSIKRLLKNGWLTGTSGDKVENDTILSPTEQLRSWIDR